MKNYTVLVKYRYVILLSMTSQAHEKDIVEKCIKVSNFDFRQETTIKFPELLSIIETLQKRAEPVFFPLPS